MSRPSGTGRVAARLQRQGEAVAFHVEPQGSVFGPGSTLYFYADRTASSLEYSPEVAYELVRSSGARMATLSAPPLGATLASSPMGFASFETNRTYQPGLLEAPDLWLWEYLPSGARRTETFALPGLATRLYTVDGLIRPQLRREIGVTPEHVSACSMNQVQRRFRAVRLNRHQQ